VLIIYFKECYDQFGERPQIAGTIINT